MPFNMPYSKENVKGPLFDQEKFNKKSSSDSERLYMSSLMGEISDDEKDKEKGKSLNTFGISDEECSIPSIEPQDPPSKSLNFVTNHKKWNYAPYLYDQA